MSCDGPVLLRARNPHSRSLRVRVFFFCFYCRPHHLYHIPGETSYTPVFTNSSMPFLGLARSGDSRAARPELWWGMLCIGHTTRTNCRIPSPCEFCDAHTPLGSCLQGHICADTAGGNSSPPPKARPGKAEASNRHWEAGGSQSSAFPGRF